MKKSHFLLASALVLAVAAPAFAEGGIGHAGTYGDTSWYGKSTKTRAEVRAELVAAQRDGTLAAMRKTLSYPQGVELAQNPQRADSDTEQLARTGR